MRTCIPSLAVLLAVLAPASVLAQGDLFNPAQNRAAIAVGPRGFDPNSFRVPLASGVVVSDKTFSLSGYDDINRPPPALGDWDDGVFSGMFRVDRKYNLHRYGGMWLNDPATTLFEANFVDNKADNAVLAYDEDGNRLIFSEYVKGFRNGATVVFAGNRPYIIAEYKGGGLQMLHMVFDDRVRMSFDGTDEAEKTPLGRSLLLMLNEAIEDQTELEMAWRLRSYNVIREHKKDVKAADFRANGPARAAKRDSIIDRINTRRAAQNESFREAEREFIRSVTP